MAAAPNILVFDSGLGGLTVFREVVKARPDARFVYAADDAFFPYGRQEEPKLVARVLDVMERADRGAPAGPRGDRLQHRLDHVLPQLREQFQVPFVGTVPAIKPACAASSSKLVSVLGTEATVKREYTRTLIREHANDCAVTLVGSPRWPSSPRPNSRRDRQPTRISPPKSRPASSNPAASAPTRSCWPARIIRCCCDRLQRLAPWPVHFIDPAPAIARRVVDLLGPAVAGAPPQPAQAIFTSGQSPPRRSPRRSPVSASSEAAARKCLTPPANPPKYRPSRGPSGPARCFATRGFASFRKTLRFGCKTCRFRASSGTKEGAILKPELNMRTR